VSFTCNALRIFFVSVALIAVSTQGNASICLPADPAALKWLDKMSRSTNEVNYNGVVTFQRGDNMQVMQIAHSVVAGTSSESLTQLTGQGAQVVRVDHPLHCVHPGHRLLRLGNDFQAGSCGISQHYRLSVSDGELIAGRKSVRIQVDSRDMYRYGYIMELDRETGLLLKTQTLGPGSKILERFQFAKLSYGPDNAAAQTGELVHTAEHPAQVPQDSASTLPSKSWNIRWLPGGFTATDMPGTGTSRQTFTDGLAVFSVFLEELPQDIRPGDGVVRRGGTTSYSRGMNLSGRSVLVTVIGEVPINTARMVADSIRWMN
jgi:sigma-E factor negative regulatory protein RseB